MNVKGFRIPAGLAAGGGVLGLGMALALPGLEPVFRFLIALAALPGLIAASWIFRCADRLAEADRTALREEREALRERRQTFRAERASLRAELDRRVRNLERREADLADRLTHFHEWMEFPGELDAPLDEERPPEPEPEELRRKDQAALEVVRERTDRIFEKIKRGAYFDQGTFQAEQVWTEVGDLFDSVARIYNPQSQNPLLETSVEQLCRAISRASLQVLVAMDGLPLDLKKQNIRGMYENVRKGVKAYGVYRDWKPWWDKTQSLRWAGRLAISSNPVTGITWLLVQEGAIYGARKFSTHVAERYALGLLFDLSFIIGGEAAGIFGGDFRHRDPDWIYGAELTELLRRAPLTQDTLRAGLNEVGRLRLRSEYDRVFLYRCMAGGKSAHPERYDCQGYLSLPERQRLAERLESFLVKHIDAPPAKAEKWTRAAEERLGIRLRVDADAPAAPEPEQAEDALRCLAGFLMEAKRLPADRLADALAETRCAERLAEAAGPEARDRRIQGLSAEPPMVFDYPELDPGGPLLDPFLEDLTDLCVQVFPWGRGERAVLENTARFFRRKDLKSLLKRMDKNYVEHLFDRLPEDSPERRLKPEAARALLAALPGEEDLRFLYRDARIDFPTEAEPMGFPGEGALWLLGGDGWVRLLRLAEAPGENRPAADLIWEGRDRGEGAVTLTEENGRFGGHLWLSGGIWNAAEGDGASIRIPGPALGGREKFFRPLRRFVGQEPKIVEAE